MAGLFTEKATLTKILKRKDLGKTFECRIETEALDEIERHHLKVDLQGIKRSCRCSTVIFSILLFDTLIFYILFKS